MSKKLFIGDCLDILKTLPDNSVDSIVTDPPYGLGKEPNAVDVMSAWVKYGFYNIKGTGFMNNDWDVFVPQPIIWRECYRVLKPGGNLLSFAGTRTQDWMAMSLRFAGFEIRDTIAWVYGSGFPKSHNVGKAIGKLQGNKREIIGTKIVKGGDNLNIISRNGKNDSVNAKGCGAYGVNAKQINIKISETKGSSKWEGWGTALKPAFEPIIMARKPISEKTIAKNVLKWGTGGINIDECRIESSKLDKFIMDKKASKTPTTNYSDSPNKIYGAYAEDKAVPSNPIGRFPANFIHDGSDEVIELFPKNKPTKPHAITSHIDKYEGYGSITHKKGDVVNYNEGINPQSTARFFYCAKASKSEKNKGLIKNDHQTVKPIKLMRYLCKLVTRKNGKILDPFMGSGTTGIACVIEGFDFIGIDKKKKYVKLSKDRIEYYEECQNNCW